MRISTGLVLGVTLILGAAAVGGCDDKDSGKETEKHETRAAPHADATATSGSDWIAVKTQRASVWRFTRQAAPLSASRLAAVGANAPAPQPAENPPDDALAEINAAIGANMLPTRDSVHSTDLVNRALQSVDPPGSPEPPPQPAAILITTPWNDDTLLLWIAVPSAIMTDSTAVSVEFNPKTVANFRPLGDPATLTLPATAPGRTAMLYELFPMTDSAQAKAGTLKYAVLHVTGAGAGQPKVDRAITDADAAGGIDVVPDAVQFAVAVAGFGGLLRGDPAVRDLSCADTIALAGSTTLPDPDGWHAQIVALMHRAEPLIDLPPREPPPAEEPPK